MQIVVSQNVHSMWLFVETVLVTTLALILMTTTIISLICKCNSVNPTQLKPTKTRAIWMISIHFSSFFYAVSVFFAMFVQYKTTDMVICKVACYCARVSWCFFRATKLLLYYQRLAVLIDKDLYSQWVRIICMFLAGSGLMIVLPTAILIIKPTLSNGGECVYADTSSYPDFKYLDWNVFLGDSVIQITASCIFLGLFLLPIFKTEASTNWWILTARRQLVITTIDIIFDIICLSVVAYLSLGDRDFWSILMANVLCGNVMLIFIFSDWRRRILPCSPVKLERPSFSTPISSGYDYRLMGDNRKRKAFERPTVSSINASLLIGSLLDDTSAPFDMEKEKSGSSTCVRVDAQGSIHSNLSSQPRHHQNSPIFHIWGQRQQFRAPSYKKFPVKSLSMSGKQISMSSSKRTKGMSKSMISLTHTGTSREQIIQSKSENKISEVNSHQPQKL